MSTTHRPAGPAHGVHRHGRTVAVALALLVAVMVVAGTASAGATGVQDPSTPSTTTLGDAPLPGQSDGSPAGADCGPGNIVRFPNCGQEPRSEDDPGGSMQVVVFFLVCLAIVGIGVGLWRWSRRLRAQRRAAGRDPVEVARRSGTGVRHTDR